MWFYCWIIFEQKNFASFLPSILILFSVCVYQCCVSHAHSLLSLGGMGLYGHMAKTLVASPPVAYSQAYLHVNTIIIITIFPINLIPNNVCKSQGNCSGPYQIKYNTTSSKELVLTALILVILFICHNHALHSSVGPGSSPSKESAGVCKLENRTAFENHNIIILWFYCDKIKNTLFELYVHTFKQFIATFRVE